MKNGFVVLTFLVYFGLYTFLCGIILCFCTFFIQIVQVTHAKSRALYAYHTVQKKFADDCCCLKSIQIENKKIKLVYVNKLIVWKVKGHSLIRKEYQQEEQNTKKATIIYFCTGAELFVPFVHNENQMFFYAGFTVNLFSSPFTIKTIVFKDQGSE